MSLKRLTTDDPQNNVQTMNNILINKDGWSYIRDGGQGVPITDYCLSICQSLKCKKLRINKHRMTPKKSESDKDVFLCDCCLFRNCPVANLYAALCGYGRIHDRLQMWEDLGLDFDRAKELAEADKEGRVRIMSEGQQAAEIALAETMMKEGNETCHKS